MTATPPTGPDGRPLARAGRTEPLAVRTFECPNCGGEVSLRGYGHSLSAVCGRCASVIDLSSPSLQVVAQFQQQAERHRPLIPLGRRGEVGGVRYDAIGFQVRSITVDGVAYRWHEYLLFNPLHGFRYLTQYNGHWNDVRVVRAVPEPAGTAGGKPAVRHGGRTYRHFQRARAVTDFALGEFPWEVREGDAAEVNDFVAPPHMLSGEATGDEVTWSVGEYVDGRAVWQAFRLDGDPPRPVGVYANQPSPHAAAMRARWVAFLALVALAACAAALHVVTARREVVLTQAYSYQPARDSGRAFVTAPFALRGARGSVEVTTETDLTNGWLFLSYALIDERTGTAYDFGREVSRYEGVDTDGSSWSEGSRRDRVKLGDIPEGRYYLRVEPQGGPGAPVNYTVRVRRDVPNGLWFWLALLALLVPPVWGAIRHGTFETARWQESDYATATTGDDEEE